MATMDAETTKYLGGDVEHTHLVKGLDYALLVKIREEDEKQQHLEVRCGCKQKKKNIACSLARWFWFCFVLAGVTGGVFFFGIALRLFFCVFSGQIKLHKPPRKPRLTSAS